MSAIEGKLGILAKCKMDFNLAPYLQGKAYPTYKSALAKFRTSSHSLPIERERYTNTRRAERMCSLGCDSIGDEAHYLLECKHPSIIEVSKPLLKKSFLRDSGIGKMNNNDKLVHILSSDQCINISGKLCYKVMKRYNEIVF